MPTVFCSCSKQRDDLDDCRSDSLLQWGEKLTSPADDESRKAGNTIHAWVFFNLFQFCKHTMNQTAATAINKQRHYDNGNVKIVRSMSLCMFNQDSGQGFYIAH